MRTNVSDADILTNTERHGEHIVKALESGEMFEYCMIGWVLQRITSIQCVVSDTSPIKLLEISLTFIQDLVLYV
jgi:hypothetical protein